MKTIKTLVFIVLYCLFNTSLSAQEKNIQDSLAADSSEKVTAAYIFKQKEDEKIDSIVAARLEAELQEAQNDLKKKNELEEKLREIATRDSLRKADRVNKLTQLKETAVGYPVVLLEDTLFSIYTQLGLSNAKTRAEAISARLEKLYHDAFFSPDSLRVVRNEITSDIIYKTDAITSVTDLDALWYNKKSEELANEYLGIIKTKVVELREENSLKNWLIRIGYVCLIIVGIWLIVYAINRLFKYINRLLYRHKSRYFNGITIKKLNLLSPAQHYFFARRISNLLRLAIIILALYLALPLLFSIFPHTQKFAAVLINWILTPARAILNGIINFLPNLFTIAVIYIVTIYLIKLVKYFAVEVHRGVININGFYQEWAMPTFNIVRALIYAFMFVVIFPYLPGSNSPAFQGVTVFLGVLVSLGSSSAIANLVAGLVITYMRPFKTGDRVKIGDITGDVIEKTLLVTRLRTIKNEDITVPNSNILSGHTINYSANTGKEGLILNTAVTIGYDVPWKDVHQALIDAALRTADIIKDPLPFVLQTGLEDFYVSYQVNAYTHNARQQAVIYSELHKNIQDVFNERGIEIMSPHYSNLRDGNQTTIPQDYLAKDYKAPSFNVHVPPGKE